MPGFLVERIAPVHLSQRKNKNKSNNYHTPTPSAELIKYSNKGFDHYCAFKHIERINLMNILFSILLTSTLCAFRLSPVQRILKAISLSVTTQSRVVKSAVILIDIAAVQNLLAPLCCVLNKDTLWHFPCLVVLARKVWQKKI